jgi:transposase
VNRAGFVGGSRKFSAEVRERAVRMVFEHRPEHTSQWAAIASIAAKIGCTAQTLSSWVSAGRARPGPAARHVH